MDRVSVALSGMVMPDQGRHKKHACGINVMDEVGYAFMFIGPVHHLP